MLGQAETVSGAHEAQDSTADAAQGASAGGGPFRGLVDHDALTSSLPCLHSGDVTSVMNGTEWFSEVCPKW